MNKKISIMNHKKELTRELVKGLGLNKLKVITSDMRDEYTIIEDYAFWHCNSLISITIPNSVTSIGNYAFCDCYSITSITIPNSVTTIEDSAFNGCFSLTSITIPSSVTSIGYFVFNGCSSLTSITIPNSVTKIERHTFDRCNKLKNVVIGDKTYGTQEVFNGKCTAYKAFYSDMICRGFKYEEGKTYEIEGELELCKRGFHACLNLLDVFNYYSGEIGKDVIVHEVELEGVSEETSIDDSKVVANKITIGKRIL